jgi:predicted small lipoprotein YifL
VNRPAFVRLAVASTLALLLVAGCGRKGSLDSPPGTWASPGITPAPQIIPDRPPPQQYDAEGKPIPHQGPHRRLPMDWLID